MMGLYYHGTATEPIAEAEGSSHKLSIRRANKEKVRKTAGRDLAPFHWGLATKIQRKPKQGHSSTSHKDDHFLCVSSQTDFQLSIVLKTMHVKQVELL